MSRKGNELYPGSDSVRLVHQYENNFQTNSDIKEIKFYLPLVDCDFA